jgi:hypothetical protein
MSRPRKAIALLIRDKSLPAGTWQVVSAIFAAASAAPPFEIHGRDTLC